MGEKQLFQVNIEYVHGEIIIDVRTQRTSAKFVFDIFSRYKKDRLSIDLKWTGDFITVRAGKNDENLQSKFHHVGNQFRSENVQPKFKIGEFSGKKSANTNVLLR